MISAFGSEIMYTYNALIKDYNLSVSLLILQGAKGVKGDRGFAVRLHELWVCGFE